MHVQCYTLIDSFSSLSGTPFSINVTRHEKIGLMCTKYTSSNYFTFCVSYRSSVNCIKFSLVCSTSFESFINKLNLGVKLCNLKVQKVVKFDVHISPIFSCWVTNFITIAIKFYVNGQHFVALV